MKSLLEVEERADPAAWNEAVMDRAAGTLFHRHEWCRLMEGLPGVRFHPCWVGETPLPVFEQEGRWSWSLLGYGGPCPPDGESLSFSALESVLEAFQGSPTTRIALAPGSRCFHDLEGLPGWRHRTVHHLNLEGGYEAVWQRCAGKARTGVRYARRRGVEVVPLETDRWRQVLHPLYRRHMARLEAAYTLSADFLDAVAHRLGSAALGLGGFAEGRPVAASVFLFDRTTAYHWIHVADAVGRRLQASYPLMAAGLRAAVERGCRTVDLGASHRPSVARHKESWGARPVEHPHYEPGQGEP